MGVNMAKKREDMSRKALMLLVVAVLVVSLVGTWLVLQSGFSSDSDATKGTISFSKTGNTYGNALVERNPDSAGKVSFVKEG